MCVNDMIWLMEQCKPDANDWDGNGCRYRGQVGGYHRGEVGFDDLPTW